MTEFEQRLIVTGDLNLDSSTLTRGLGRVPDGYRNTPIVDLEGLNQKVVKGSEFKFVIVNVTIPSWQEVVKELSEKGVKVYVLSVLSSVRKAREAYQNGASYFDQDLGDIFRKIASDAGQ